MLPFHHKLSIFLFKLSDLESEINAMFYNECVIYITQNEFDEANELLNSVIEHNSCKTIVFSGVFEDGIEADIRIVEDIPTPWVECLLCDENGNVLRCSKPTDSIEEYFTFSFMESNDNDNCLNEVIYTVKIVVKN